jgi:hypothetical protein
MKLTGYSNLLAGVTPTANSTATGYPVTNLQNRQLWSRTRTVDGTFALVLTYDLGSSEEIPIVSAFGHNLLDDAEIQVEVSDASDFSTGYDSGAVAAFDLTRSRPVDVRPAAGWPIIHVPTTAPSGRYVRLTLDDGSRVSGHVELGHAHAGPMIELRSRQWALGNDVPLGSAGLREWMLPAIVSEHDTDELRILHEWSQSTGGRFLLIPRPDETDSWQYQVIWCVASEERFETAWQSGGTAANAFAEVRLGLREVAY